MSKCLSPILYLSLLLAFTIAEEGQVCFHQRDVSTLWVIQCFGLNSTNAGQLTFILEDTKRILPHKRMLVEVSDSDGAAVPDGVFDEYWVESLTMKNCNFTSLPFHVIANMSARLLKLQLGDNQISDMDFARFNQLQFAPLLQHLELNNNRIASMPQDAFANFTRLDTLDLSNNILEELVDNTFRGAVRLRILYLQNNQLDSIGSSSFADLPNLYLLTLDENKISFLEEGTLSLQNQSSLTELPLEGNPFYCNCTLQWLKDYLSSIHYLEISGATCVAPKIAKFQDIEFCADERSAGISARNVKQNSLRKNFVINARR